MKPTNDQITTFLTDYGWSSRLPNNDSGPQSVLTNYKLENGDHGILVSLHVEGEFVMVSTVGLLSDLSRTSALDLLKLNDTLKLVKIFALTDNGGDKLTAEVGFELWAESWTKETFFCFLDMMCLGIEKALAVVKQENISHQTRFVTYNV